jgi:hypothetical protein
VHRWGSNKRDFRSHDDDPWASWAAASVMGSVIPEGTEGSTSSDNGGCWQSRNSDTCEPLHAARSYSPMAVRQKTVHTVHTV